MKNKLFVLVFFSIISLSMVSAQPLQDVEVEEEFTDLTGGEATALEGSFENQANRELPLFVQVDVSEEERSLENVDQAFNLDVVLESDEEEFNLECGYSGTFFCGNDSVMRVQPQSSNEFEIEVEASSMTASGNYIFEVDLLTRPGVGTEITTEDLTENETETVGAGNVRVDISPSEDGEVNVTEVDFVSVPEPSDSQEFVRGVTVSTEADVEEGYIEVEYSQGDVSDLEEDSLSFYRYSETGQEWESIDSELDTDENVITAEVEGFSTYAVYGEEEDDSPTVIDAPGQPAEPEEDEEPANETDEETEEEEEPEEELEDPEVELIVDGPPVAGQEVVIETVVDGDHESLPVEVNGEEIGETEDGQITYTLPEEEEVEISTSLNDTEDTETVEVQGLQPETPQTPTGQFVEQASSNWYVIVGLLAAVIAYVIYRKEPDFSSIKNRF